MGSNSNSFESASVRLFATLALAASLALAPTLVRAAGMDAHEDRAEMRISHMHDQLKITPAEEAQWGMVAQTMRDNAKTMDGLTQARLSRGKGMTAIDDLQSYGEISEAHADAIRKLTPVFADLYASMSDAQKKEADSLFSHGDRRHAQHKHMHKMVDGK